MKYLTILTSLTAISIFFLGAFSISIAQEKPATVTVRVTSANGDVTDLEVHTENEAKKKNSRGNAVVTDKVTYVSNGSSNGGSTNNEDNQQKAEDALISTFDITNIKDIKVLLNVRYQ